MNVYVTKKRSSNWCEPIWKDKNFLNKSYEILKIARPFKRSEIFFVRNKEDGRVLCLAAAFIVVGRLLCAWRKKTQIFRKAHRISIFLIVCLRSFYLSTCEQRVNNKYLKKAVYCSLVKCTPEFLWTLKFLKHKVLLEN